MSKENIAQLLNDKDSENTKKSTKQHRLTSESYHKETNLRNPATAVELAAVLGKFYAEARKKGWTGAKLLTVKLIFSFESLKYFE